VYEFRNTFSTPRQLLGPLPPQNSGFRDSLNGLSAAQDIIWNTTAQLFSSSAAFDATRILVSIPYAFLNIWDKAQAFLRHGL
jgi:hypothetical protein